MNIKKLIQHIKDAFKRLLEGVGKEILGKADEAIAIANHIKGYLDGTATGIVTSLIPGTWDDRLMESAKAFLDKVLPSLLNMHACNQAASAGERYTCYLGKIKEMTPLMQNAVLFKLASAYVMEHFKELAEHEADSVVQGKYLLIK